MTTLTHDPWATLPTNWRTPTSPTQQTPPTRYHHPTPNLDRLPDPTCNPHCRNCNRPEGKGHCHRCYIVCNHTKHPSTTHLCLIRTRAAAALHTGPATGRPHYLVAECPHCGQAHTHSTEPVHPYRRAGCGQPYLLEVTP